MQILDYTEHDIPDMIDCIERFIYDVRKGETNAYSFLDMDRNKLYNYINECRNNPLVFTKVVVKDGKIVGGIQGRLIEYFFSYDKIVVDEILYIDEGLMSGRTVMRLVQAYVDWAKHMGAKEVMLSTSTQQHLESFTKFVEAQGFELVAYGFKKRID